MVIRSWTKIVVGNKFYLQHFDYTLVMPEEMLEEDYQSVIETLQTKFVANYHLHPRSDCYGVLSW